VFIKKLKLKNFRCFTDCQFEFDGRFVVIHGKNGTGKTSLLEALHYSCYLRSFRTNTQNDLINLNTQERHPLFVQLNVQTPDTRDMGATDVIQVGYCQQEGKLVKLNKKPIRSYKELISHYRIISVTADDICLVAGSPGQRRDFLNYAFMLENPDFLHNLKQYKQVLQQRNSLLKDALMQNKKQNFQDQLYIWTKKLWEQTNIIQEQRRAYLDLLGKRVNILLKQYFNTFDEDKELEIAFAYRSYNIEPKDTFEKFWAKYQNKHYEREEKLERSVFGIHLDDFSILFQSKRARVFASRGQQKLIVLLIKIAQMQQTIESGGVGVMLIDDFLTDLDDQRATTIAQLLVNLDFQVFITSPIAQTSFLNEITQKNKCLIEL